MYPDLPIYCIGYWGIIEMYPDLLIYCIGVRIAKNNT